MEMRLHLESYQTMAAALTEIRENVSTGTYLRGHPVRRPFKKKSNIRLMRVCLRGSIVASLDR